jgi:lysyl-tRNA synthetase class 2
VYELGRVFRNEGLSIKHNPEFTMMELYEAYSDYEDMMNLIEELIREVMEEVIGSASLDYEGLKLDFSKPFCRLTMLDAVKDYAGVDFDTINSIEEAMIIAKEHGLDVEPFHKKGDVLNLFFEAFVEHKLIEPTFLIDHPVEISPLTKKKPDNPEYVERFELYIMGREFANAYSELNDPLDQRERFMHQAAMREQGNEEANVLDEEFLMAMEYGMPPAGGLGLGIDRFVMLLTQASSIRDVLLFPTMKIKKT